MRETELEPAGWAPVMLLIKGVEQILHGTEKRKTPEKPAFPPKAALDYT